ncbi:hypothetical protein [Polaromonas sp.]|uniref:hypothetical protein n=1 Tax=Polaromonas sp. TaxID=1869339 RepID=UPI001DA43D58|nr:hypothetical protein [Polaromonas sp.]MBT9475781.1 hypothetical protein [Polaromonas sp.]
MSSLEDEDRGYRGYRGYRGRLMADNSESIDNTSQRIETNLREWEQNQRWQLNEIRQELKAISKTIAWVGMAVLIAVIIYVKQAMKW